MRIAVAGGTGWIGRLVVDEVRRSGDTAVVLSRGTGVDLTTGSGLATKLDGADVVIDVSNIAAGTSRAAIAFFDAATRHLLAAERDVGIGHHVALSIVGIDRVDLGYYLGKRRQVELIEAGPVPWTVLPATQFHEFAAQMLAGRSPVVAVPRMLSQPVAASEVARLLAELARAAPAGLVGDLAGPEQHRMPDLVRRLARARGDRRLVFSAPTPGKVDRQIAAGGLLPPGGTRGSITFEEWLASPAAARRRADG